MKYIYGLKLLIALSFAHVMGTPVWIVTNNLFFARNLIQGLGKLNLQTGQPASGGIPPGDPSLHQLFPSWRADTVTWSADARFLTSVALHVTFCGFTIEKYWLGLSKISKIWACAVEFLFCSLPFPGNSYRSFSKLLSWNFQTIIHNFFSLFPMYG